MNDEIKKLIEESDAPLDPAARDFFDGITKKTIQIKHSSLAIPESVLDEDRVTFVFDTNRGEYRFPYTPKFNATLTRAGLIKMDSPEHDGVRWGKLLLDNLRLPDAEFGATFTDAVLWVFVNQRFGNIPAFRDALDKVPSYSPFESDEKRALLAYLDRCLVGVNNEIVLRWRSDPEPTNAAGVLGIAVYYLIDQRYHITARRVLFPD